MENLEKYNRIKPSEEDFPDVKYKSVSLAILLDTLLTNGEIILLRGNLDKGRIVSVLDSARVIEFLRGWWKESEAIYAEGSFCAIGAKATFNRVSTFHIHKILKDMRKDPFLNRKLAHLSSHHSFLPKTDIALERLMYCGEYYHRAIRCNEGCNKFWGYNSGIFTTNFVSHQIDDSDLKKVGLYDLFNTTNLDKRVARTLTLL